MVTKGIGVTTPQAAVAAHPNLHLIQTGAGVAALVVMTAAGAILSRSRHLQVRELNEKLRTIKADL